MDDSGIMTEFIHIGIDIESYHEHSHKFPELDALGWISELKQKRLQKQVAKFDSGDNYYSTMKTVIERSVQENPHWFRTVAHKLQTLVDDTMQGRNATCKIVKMNKLAINIV